MKILKLEALVYDEEDYQEITSGIEYYKQEFGYFTPETIKDAIVTFIEERKNYAEKAFLIFTHNIELNKYNEYGCTAYTFYDESGNILSDVSNEISEDEIILNHTNKYKVGDIVYHIPDTMDKSNVEKGIISNVPNKLTNHYTILIGCNLHDHVHTLEEFIFPLSENEVDWQNETLKIRLEKIGF